MISIRPYVPADYSMISSWWNSHEMAPPEENMMPETSYVLERDGVPVQAVSLFMTNGPVCWVDNLIGNPEIKDRETKDIVKFIEKTALESGKDRLFCMSMTDKNERLYKSLGFIKTAHVSTFIKKIEGDKLCLQR